LGHRSRTGGARASIGAVGQRAGGTRARRANYGFEKRQKEVKKQQKRDEKAEKKRLRREGAPEGSLDGEGGDDAPEQDGDEEGSDL
jgi:hypothetical protein